MLCLECYYADIRLIFVVLYTFTRVLYLCLILSSVHVFAALERSFVAHLQVLVNMFITNQCAAFARAFIYSLSFEPCACVLACLFIESLELCDRFIFYFVDIVGAPGRLDIHSF
jgi:hypothetical protein